MPYIKQESRPKYDTVIDQLKPGLNIGGIPTKGELEYCIFKLMMIYMKDKEYTYTNLHACTYAAHHCGDEFRRRFLDKREDDAKILKSLLEKTLIIESIQKPLFQTCL